MLNCLYLDIKLKMQENSRNNLVKRKIPDTFYEHNPVLKTQVFSNEQRAHINHSHTNSLPIQDQCIAPVNNLTGSYSSLCETTPSKFDFSVKQQPVSIHFSNFMFTLLLYLVY